MPRVPQNFSEFFFRSLSWHWRAPLHEWKGSKADQAEKSTKVYFSGPCFHISRHQSDTSPPCLLLQHKTVLLSNWSNLLDNLKRDQALSSGSGWWTGFILTERRIVCHAFKIIRTCCVLSHFSFRDLHFSRILVSFVLLVICNFRGTVNPTYHLGCLQGRHRLT